MYTLRFRLHSVGFEQYHEVITLQFICEQFPSCEALVCLDIVLSYLYKYEAVASPRVDDLTVATQRPGLPGDGSTYFRKIFIYEDPSAL